MGCGSSSQPGAGKPDDIKPEKSSPEISTDIETFKGGTPSPSPMRDPSNPASPLKDEQIDGDVSSPVPASPVPSYHSGGREESELSFGSPAITSSSPGVISMDPYQQSRALAPAYKIENEPRKIGGFDPEAFRKANQKTQDNNQVQASDWASPPPKSSFEDPTSGGGGGYQNGGGFSSNNNNGGGNSWAQSSSKGEPWGENVPRNQGDYIQSDDIFTTKSPQAYNNNARMDFTDDADPFRAPGGLGDSHQSSRSPFQNAPDNKHITNEDDALMDDILGELDDL